MVAIELASPGRPRISRKTIAQGRPGVLRWTCMLVCALCCARCTRDRGCSAHPVFPAPSNFSGARQTKSKARAHRAARISFVVLAKARTHTLRPIDKRMLRDTFFQQQMTGIMGPGLRQDDGGDCRQNECGEEMAITMVGDG